MFWKKTLDNDFISRNPSCAYNYAVVHDEIAEATKTVKFDKYIKDKRITQILSSAYEDTKGAAYDLGSSSVCASLAIQLADLLASKVRDGESEQIAWSLNVLRDIVFAYAPAIAVCDGNDAKSITQLMLKTIVKRLIQDFTDEELQLILPLLKAVQGEANGHQ